MSIRSMARAIALAGCFCLLAATSMSTWPQAAKRSPAEDAKIIQELETKLSAAFIKRDQNFLSSVIADDSIHVGSDGQKMNKETYLATVTRDRKYTAYVNQAMASQVYGDVAIVNGPEKVTGVFSGWEGSVEFVTTRVWAYRGNKWQIVLWQATTSGKPQQTNKSMLDWLHGGR